MKIRQSGKKDAHFSDAFANKRRNLFRRKMGYDIWMIGKAGTDSLGAIV